MKDYQRWIVFWITVVILASVVVFALWLGWTVASNAISDAQAEEASAQQFNNYQQRQFQESERERAAAILSTNNPDAMAVYQMYQSEHLQTTTLPSGGQSEGHDKVWR